MMRAVPGISDFEPPLAADADCEVMERESVWGLLVVVAVVVVGRVDEGSSVPPARALSLDVRPRRV